MKRNWFFSVGLAASDAVMVYVSFWLAYRLRFEFQPFLDLIPASKGTPPWPFYKDALKLVVPLWVLVFALWGPLYQKRFTEAADEFLTIAKCVVLGTVLIIAATFLYREYEYSRLVMGIAFLNAIVLLFLSRRLWGVSAARVYRRIVPKDKVLIIGGGKSIDLLARLIEKDPHTEARTFLADQAARAREHIFSGPAVAEVFVAGDLLKDEQVLNLIDDCEEQDIEIKILPDFLEMRMGEILVDQSLKVPILHLKPLSLHGFRFFVKRLFDVTLSILAVSLLFFPFLVLSLLVLLDSRGGVFFTQERVGFKEKAFKCLKFRTMHRDAETKLKEMNLPSFRGGPAFKMKGDPRVTRVGRWIRKFSLDECGQIWNVLKGEMSLIGPRPQVLAEANGNPDWARKRYRVLPGITGLWQVSGRADLSYEDMMRLDIYYLENWSPGLDLQILLKTFPVILGGKGAY